MEVSQRLDGFDDESNPELFVGEQSGDDEADRLLRHVGCLPVSAPGIHSRQYPGHKQRPRPIADIPFVQSQFPARFERLRRGIVTGGPAGKYLVDDSGKAVYLVDPGINGSHTTRPDGTEVRKYDAPKAVLMSYIIKGILDQQLPWALVIFGVIIALVLEMASVPSLPFAVGVYLPL